MMARACAIVALLMPAEPLQLSYRAAPPRGACRWPAARADARGVVVSSMATGEAVPDAPAAGPGDDALLAMFADPAFAAMCAQAAAAPGAPDAP